MPLGWREGVFAATAEGRTVVLDVFAGRYRGCPSSCEDALARLDAAREPDVAEREALAPLLACGLLVERASVGRTLRLEPPAAPLEASDAIVLTRPDVAAACLAQIVARLLVAGVGFAGAYRLLRYLEGRRRVVGRQSGDDGLLRWVRAIERSEVLFTRRDRCLTRSLALRLLSIVYRLDAVLVIGIRISPFAAHSWVERDGKVLNDVLEEVGRYVPILAI